MQIRKEEMNGFHLQMIWLPMLEIRKYKTKNKQTKNPAVPSKKL